MSQTTLGGIEYDDSQLKAQPPEDRHKENHLEYDEIKVSVMFCGSTEQRWSFAGEDHS